MAKNPRVLSIYKKLYRHFGPQGWWPADTPFEVMVGAILTQNTSWRNVERAIANLKKKRILSLKKMQALPSRILAPLIKPAGYYNIKARRLRCFLKFLCRSYGGSLKKIRSEKTHTLRNNLLSVKGIGPETADSILLYALNKPVFVVDAYTKRIFSRHRLIEEGSTYDQVQDFITKNLKIDVKLFNEYHALLVKLGKEYCLKRKPRCAVCPLSEDIPQPFWPKIK